MEKINLHRIFSGASSLTTELKRISSSLHGEDGNPILKFTELFASPDDIQQPKGLFSYKKKKDVVPFHLK